MDHRRPRPGHRAAGDGPRGGGGVRSGFIQLSAVTLVYILICIAAIQYFWREIRAATGADPSAGRSRAASAACAAIGGFGAALIVIHTFFPLGLRDQQDHPGTHDERLRAGHRRDRDNETARAVAGSGAKPCRRHHRGHGFFPRGARHQESRGASG